EQHFAIGARLRFGYDLLVALPTFGDVCKPGRAEVESVQEGSVIKGSAAPSAIAIKQVEHAIGGGAGLLNGGIPLTKDACAPCHRVVGLDYISGGIDIWSVGTHGGIDLDSASAADAAAFDK